MPNLQGKKAVMVIAKQNFRDEELAVPKEILEKQGVAVTVASTTLNAVKGVLGLTIKPEKLLPEVKVADYDAVIFVGGGGAAQYFFDPQAHKLAQDAVAQGKVLGAICIAPATLAEAGVLQGKRATVFSSEVGKLKAGGAEYTGRDVERDGNIITANGPGAAQDFGRELIRALGGI